MADVKMLEIRGGAILCGLLTREEAETWAAPTPEAAWERACGMMIAKSWEAGDDSRFWWIGCETPDETFPPGVVSR